MTGFVKENPVSDSCKASIVVPFDDKLADMLDRLPSCVQCSGDFDLQESTQESFYGSDESNSPPPMPYYFERRTSAPRAQPLSSGFLLRARSSSPNRCASGISGREYLQSKAMSMPNLLSSRSTHNRGIGLSVLTEASECGQTQGTKLRCSRMEEFEALLEGM